MASPGAFAPVLMDPWILNDGGLVRNIPIDVARQLSLVISSDLAPGIYHATAQGMCSWFRFAQEIFSLLNIATRLRPAKPGEFPRSVPRPPMSVLDNRCLAVACLDAMPNWR